jgi:hypothetical protein
VSDRLVSGHPNPAPEPPGRRDPDVPWQWHGAHYSIPGVAMSALDRILPPVLLCADPAPG